MIASYPRPSRAASSRPFRIDRSHLLLIGVLATWLSATIPLAAEQQDASAQQPAMAQQTDAPAEQPAATTGEQASPPTIKPTLDSDLIDSKIAEIEANASLTDEVKQSRIERYRSIASNLQDTRSYNQQAASFRKDIESAPRTAATIRQEIDAMGPLPDPPVDLPQPAKVAEIEDLLARELAEAASLDVLISELQKAIDKTQQEPAEARKRIVEIKQALTDLDAELSALPQAQTDAAANTDADQAKRWLLESRRDALRAEMLMLEQRTLSADARRELLQARLEKAQRQLKRIKERRAYLENQADRLRQADAKRAQTEAEAAKHALANADPAVRALADGNAALAGEINDLTTKLDHLDEQQQAIEQRTEQVQQDYRSARQRLEAGALNRATGQVLIDEQQQLPDLRSLRAAADERSQAIADATLRQIQLRDELRALDDLDAYVEERLAKVPEQRRDSVRPQLRQQAERRRELLKQAIEVEDSWLRGLGELAFAAGQLMDAVSAYKDFLAERLLWVRSMMPVTEQPFSALPAALAWLVSPKGWAEVAKVMVYELSSSPLLWLGLAVIAALFARYRAIRRAIRATAEPLRRVSTDRFGYTLSAIGLTLLLSAPSALLLALLGWQLDASVATTAYTKAVGQALISVSVALFYLNSFRLLCMPGGVADRHFRWSGETLTKLRRNFKLGAFTLLPVGYVATAIFGSQDPDFAGTLGRLTLVALTLILAALTARVLHPRRGAIAGVLAARPEGWTNRLRHLWYPLVVGVPAALGILALIGFQYTAGVLLSSLVSELWLVLALVVVHQSIVRWLIVTRRSLALKAALDRRAAREAQKEAAAKGAETLTQVESEVDLSALDNQTRRLLNSSIVIAGAVGLWLIWSDVLPALNVFDRVTLWTYRSGPDGAAETNPVTLADIGLILVIIVTAFIAGRNLPGLLEILLLKNTEITAGSRYTITTLTGYVITAIGALLVFNQLGLSWGQVQWLVAALGVGIGFGLQEIVANFISGLIILFERPVRVGDIVTIGDTTGTVSKIEIRATTIRNWDKQELLVPNKEFITGRLLNWTLTDQLNRVTIPVGVAYGTDTRKALAILAEVADQHERLLKDPAPLITFESFGDNALTLVLRCYLDSLEFRLATITELHQTISDRFAAAGINIAFPQRDVHLHAAKPLDIRLHRDHGTPLAAEG